VFDYIDTVTRRKRLRINLPASMALAAGRVEEWRARVFSTRAFFSRGWVEMILENARLSSAKATRELGYSITPWKQSMGRMIRWLRSTHAGNCSGRGSC
jgi:hypothetical protein